MSDNSFPGGGLDDDLDGGLLEDDDLAGDLPEDDESFEFTEVDEDERLAQAVRLKTVSSQSDAQLNADQFEALHARIAEEDRQAAADAAAKR